MFSLLLTPYYKTIAQNSYLTILFFIKQKGARVKRAPILLIYLPINISRCRQMLIVWMYHLERRFGMRIHQRL